MKKKLLIAFCIWSKIIVAQHDFELRKCQYFLNINDFSNDVSKSAIFELKYKNESMIKNNGGGEFRFKQENLSNKIVNQEIFMIQCADSTFVNLKKLDKEMGYSLVREYSYYLYLTSYQEASKKATTNSILFGAVGAIASKLFHSFIIIDSEMNVLNILSKVELKNKLKNLQKEDLINDLNKNWCIEKAIETKIFIEKNK